MSETYRASRRGEMLSTRSAVSRHYSPPGKNKAKKSEAPAARQGALASPIGYMSHVVCSKTSCSPHGVELTTRRHSRQPVVHHRLRVAVRQRSESPTLRAKRIASPVELSLVTAGASGNEGAVVDHGGAYRNTVQRSCLFGDRRCWWRWAADSSARLTTALRRVPRRAVNCRREQTRGASGRWREELRYCRYWPPLTQSVSPVMNAPPSLTRNITALAISAGLASRPTGILATIFSRISGGTAATIAVSVYPAAMTLTVMPRAALSSASALVKPIMPALAAA